MNDNCSFVATLQLSDALSSHICSSLVDVLRLDVGLSSCSTNTSAHRSKSQSRHFYAELANLLCPGGITMLTWCPSLVHWPSCTYCTNYLAFFNTLSDDQRYNYKLLQASSQWSSRAQSNTSRIFDL